MEANDWDLAAAYSTAVKDGVSEADMDVEQLLPHSPPPPETRVDTVPVNPNTNVHTSDPTFFIRHPSDQSSAHFVSPNTNPSDTQAVQGGTILEKDTGPVAACGHVRILHFTIQLELPSECGVPGICSECFTFPETETVASLKRHFIQLRLAELTVLATSAEWSEHFSEVNPNTLLAHLRFDSTGSPQTFTDDSVRSVLWNTFFTPIRPRMFRYP
ncbi:unnamed protein product [Echinostoma caproni]|uniref:Uncharacterized protein n=1 Tax=Echinostoma caproni TaxID=27848 RepID=A0A3P8IBV2_9TREM|nr:unnamed protein product [Echinostoma caproni]